MFNKLKIGVRLWLGFAAILAIQVVINIFFTPRLAALDEAMNRVTQDYYPKTVIVNNLMGAINQVARSMRTALLTKNDKVIVEEGAKIREARNKAIAALGDLDKSITDEEGRAKLQVVKERRAEYGAAQEKFLALMDDYLNLRASKGEGEVLDAAAAVIELPQLVFDQQQQVWWRHHPAQSQGRGQGLARGASINDVVGSQTLQRADR